jgi:D-glycero-D-manno-heptose 1,7-bisphosphate phosphatase
MQPAVFLDKDGTLIDNIPWNVDPALIRLAFGAAECLTLLKDHGYKLFVVSNQPGVAWGMFPESALDGVSNRLRGLLADLGVALSGFYYCPHHPDAALRAYAARCQCRKPAPGMVIRAAHEHDIDLHRSWFIGDILDDVEAGFSAGCRTILIDNGNETEWQMSPARTPTAIAANLAEAALIATAVEP